MMLALRLDSFAIFSVCFGPLKIKIPPGVLHGHCFLKFVN